MTEKCADEVQHADNEIDARCVERLITETKWYNAQLVQMVFMTGLFSP